MIILTNNNEMEMQSMDIEVKIDEKYDNPKIVIYTNKVDSEILNIIDGI